MGIDVFHTYLKLLASFPHRSQISLNSDDDNDDDNESITIIINIITGFVSFHNNSSIIYFMQKPTMFWYFNKIFHGLLNLYQT